MESQSTSTGSKKISAKDSHKRLHLSVSASKNVILVLCCLASGFLGGYAAVKNDRSESSYSSNESKQQIISSESQLIADVAKNTGESVVSVDVTTKGVTQNIFGFSQQYSEEGSGTGVIVSKEGVVVTNKHVVPSGTSDVKVTLYDGTVLDAEVLARDPRNDIAFIKIKDKKGKDLRVAKLGDSSKLQVGEKVIAIGNALGEFKNTVTSGIVSGYGRDITAGDSTESEQLSNLIQTDAAINRGNSGGPLVNINGEVIGINTAITGSDNGQSLGFAIPVNDIKTQITSVLEKGKIERPYLGVRFKPIDERFAYVYNLSVKQGAYIPPAEDGQKTILSDSPAEKAGLKEKDIITKIDDQVIDDKNNLLSVIARFKVGQKVSITIVRDGKEQKVSATLELAPES